MNSRRVGIALIVVAVALATVLIALGGCAPANDLPSAIPPNPSRVVDRYRLPVHPRDGSAEVIEFRDSAGRLCVLAYGSNGRASLDCVQLAPLDYENLPES
jgi:hypothetical protein